MVDQADAAIEGGAAPKHSRPPALAWIQFLRNYGPLPTNRNLFDETITTALMKAKVVPIALPTPQVESMVAYLRSGPGSLLIAGTAGDGKTYHARQVWAALGGAPDIWNAGEKVKRLLLAARPIVFIEDLSKLSSEEGESVLAGLEQAVIGGDGEESFVIGCNHGQILDRLRRRNHSENAASLQRLVQDAFFEPGTAHERLRIVDLSRVSRQSLGAVLTAITGHPEWGKCSTCALDGKGRLCPIAENRRRTIGATDGGRFASRLGDLIELARLNGSHLRLCNFLSVNPCKAVPLA